MSRRRKAAGAESKPNRTTGPYSSSISPQHPSQQLDSIQKLSLQSRNIPGKKETRQNEKVSDDNDELRYNH